IWMIGCVANAEPLCAVVDGWVAIASLLAAPAVMVIAFEVAEVNDGDEERVVGLSPIVPVMFNPLKVYTPLDAVTVKVVAKVPPPEAMAAVTVVVLSVITTLPDASCIWITGCVANAEPLCAVVDGCVAIASLLAAPAVMVIAFEVADVND